MNKIIERGSKWKSEFDNKVEVLYVHEKGVMFEYNDGSVEAYSKEEFLDRCTPIRKTHKVFRLYKFLEDEFLTSKEKADLVFSGWAQELEGKTYKEASYKLLHDNWLVEEEIK